MKHTAPIKYYLCLIALIFITACSNRSAVMSSMLVAETLMQNKPDSALTILENINKDQLSSAKEQALYALLLTQAQDKNYIDKTNDSLISVAVDYYANAKDQYHKMLAHYYKARISFNAKNYSKSIINLFKAEDAAKEIEDYYHLGLIYRTFSNIYQKVYNNVEHLHYAKLSYDSFVKSGNQHYTDWALYNVARAYHNCEEYNKSIAIAKQVIDTATARNNKSLYLAGLSIAGNTTSAIQEYKKSIQYFNKIQSISKKHLNSTDYRFLGIAYLESGNIDSALICMNNISKLDSSDKWLAYRINSHVGNINKAQELLKKELEIYNKVIADINTQNITHAIADYYDYEKETDEKNLKRGKTIRNFSLAISLLVIIFIILYFRQYSRIKQQEIDNYILQARNLEKDLENMQVANTGLQYAVNELFKKRFNDINALCDNLYPYQTELDSKQTDIIYKQIKSLLSTINFENNTVNKIEEFINRYKDNLMIKLKEQFPKMKPIDYILYMYLVIGFSYRTISFLTNLNDNNLYKKYHRLKDKIEKSEAPDKKLFLAEINKKV